MLTFLWWGLGLPFCAAALIALGFYAVAFAVVRWLA